MSSPLRFGPTALAAAVSLLLVASACGGSEGSSDEDPNGRRPTAGSAGKGGASGKGGANAGGNGAGASGGVDQTGTGGASVAGGAAGAIQGGFAGGVVFGGASGSATAGAGGVGATTGTAGSGANSGSGGAPGAGAAGSGAGAGKGGAAGVGGATTAPQRYSYDLASESWTKSPLSLLWTGSDAPQPAIVTSAVQLSDVPRLLVFTSAGMMHVQDTSTNTWRTPIALATLFGKSFVVDSSYHVPSSLFQYAVPPPAAITEDLVLSAGSFYWACRYFPNDTIEVQAMEKPLPKPGPGEPDQGADQAVWSVDVFEPGKVKDDYVGSYAVWVFYQSGALWYLDAAPKWTKLADPRSNRLFAQRPGEPDPKTLRAGWFDAATKKAHYLSPGP